MSILNLFNINFEGSLSDVKWHTLKQSVLKSLLLDGDSTIADLSAKLHSSIPTITKIINELLKEQFIIDLGKITYSGGRRPSLYSAAGSKSYFLGVEVGATTICMGLQDLKNEFIATNYNVPFVLQNTEKSFESLFQHINDFVDKQVAIPKQKISGACITFDGRVNSEKGFCLKYDLYQNKSLNVVFSEALGINTWIENTTRAMAWAEYAMGEIGESESVIYVNYSLGIGLGIIVNGSLYYGSSGFAGEFGHSPIFDNNKLCTCGKAGCLETEISGKALVDQFKKATAEGQQSSIEVSDNSEDLVHRELINGILTKEDSLCIDLVSLQSENLGKYLSLIINVLNPDVLVVGGTFTALGDFVMLPIQASLKKYSANSIIKDLRLHKSELGVSAAVLGACQIVKSKVLGSLVSKHIHSF